MRRADPGRGPLLRRLREIAVRRLAPALLGLVLLAGCRTECPDLAATYDPGPRVERRPGTPDELVVLQLAEGRPEGPDAHMGPILLLFIPLFPYVSQHVTPEYLFALTYGEEQDRKYDLRQDLTNTLAKELLASGLCGRVRSDGSGLTLRGRVVTGGYRRAVTSYGLSCYGFVFWPLAAHFGDVELGVELELVAPDGKVLGTATFLEEEFTVGTWNLMGPDFDLGDCWDEFEACVARLMPRVRRFVADALRGYVAPAVAPVADETARCPSCGAANADRSRFCIACGRQQVEQGAGDCACGRPRTAGAKFCQKCGRSL